MTSVIDFTPTSLVKIGKARNWLAPNAITILEASDSLFSVIDRTETFDLGFPIKVIDKIPTGYTEKSLEDICNQEAIKLIEMGKPLSIYWSGGIDSTLVLISLLKNGARDLTVVLTGKSIDEYPLFFEQFILNKLEYRRIRPSIFSDINLNELNVSGELGDQLMGSVDIRNYLNNFHQIHEDTWESYVLEQKGEAYLALVTEQVKKAPFKLVSAFDYIWWKNFSTKWQHVLMRMGNNHKDSTSQYLETIHHFFRADDFQLWAINEKNHRTEKIKDTFASYKHSMKRIIADYTKDTDYEVNKIKVGSLPTSMASPFLFTLDNGVSVSFSTNSTPVDYERQFGSTYDHLFMR